MSRTRQVEGRVPFAACLPPPPPSGPPPGKPFPYLGVSLAVSTVILSS
jgi:hypothetical protein